MAERQLRSRLQYGERDVKPTRLIEYPSYRKCLEASPPGGHMRLLRGDRAIGGGPRAFRACNARCSRRPAARSGSTDCPRSLRRGPLRLLFRRARNRGLSHAHAIDLAASGRINHTMALHFPNQSRAYDSRRNAGRFWDHDGAMEAVFFVSDEALRRLRTGMVGEAGLLRVLMQADR
jgi:hypothetical protein